MAPDDAMRAAIGCKGVTAESLKRMAIERSGMTTLFQDAMEKVCEGITSLEEAMTTVLPDNPRPVE